MFGGDTRNGWMHMNGKSAGRGKGKKYQRARIAFYYLVGRKHTDFYRSEECHIEEDSIGSRENL